MHFFYRVTHIVVVLILFSFLTNAQSNLPGLLEFSKANYPLLKAKQADVSSSEKRLNLSRVDYFPTLLIQDQYTFSTVNNLTGSFFPNEMIGISTTGAAKPSDNYDGVFGTLASATIDWRIFNFGRVRSNVNLAKKDLNSVKADYENELFQHQIRVADAYLLLLVSQKLKETQESNLRRAGTYKDVVKAGFNSGLRPGVDTSFANAEFAKAKILLQESKRNETVQRQRLAELLGRSDTIINVDTSFFFQHIPVTGSGYNSNNNPLLKYYKTRIGVSESRIKSLKLSYLPSLSLVANGVARGSGVSRSTGIASGSFSDGTRYSLYNYLLGVSFRWNVTSLARLKYDFESEKYQLEKTKFLYNDQELKVKRQLQESDAQLELANEQVKLAPDQLAAARNAFIQAQARYENGLTDIITLNQSLYYFNRAEVDQYVAISNLWRALLMKSAATGDLSIFLSQVK